MADLHGFQEIIIKVNEEMTKLMASFLYFSQKKNF